MMIRKKMCQISKLERKDVAEFDVDPEIESDLDSSLVQGPSFSQDAEEPATVNEDRPKSSIDKRTRLDLPEPSLINPIDTYESVLSDLVVQESKEQ